MGKKVFIKMKWIYAICFIMGIMLTCSINTRAADTSEMQIPEDAEYWCGHCYKVYDELLTPDEAKEKCESMGGYLATATSAKEYDQIWGMIESKSKAKNAYTIMGIHKAEEGWDYDNGEELCYTRWHRFRSEWKGDVYFYYDAGLCLGWSDAALVEGKVLTQWNKYGAYSQVPTGTTKSEHHIAIINGHLSFSMYAKCSTYYVPEDGDAYRSLSGKGGMVEFNENDVKNGYVCEWGDPINLTPNNVLLNGQTSDKETTVKYVYDGTSKKPSSVKVYYDNVELSLNQDYVTEIKGRSLVGAAQVNVTGINRFQGSAVKYYYVVPKQVSSLTLTRDDENRGIRITWPEVTEASEYDVRWATSTDDLNNDRAEIHNCTSEENENKVCYTKALKRGTTYYVQVRATGDRKNPEVTGAWSNTAQIKTGKQALANEYWGFENPIAFIPLSSYQKIWLPETAKELHGTFGFNNGICHGMCVLASALSSAGEENIYFSDRTLNSFDSYSSTKSVQDETGMTARKALEYAHLLKNVEPFKSHTFDNSNYYHGNRHILNEIVQAVGECQKGNGNIVTIALNNAHKVNAICIMDGMETSSETVIKIYDPVYPNDGSRYLHLSKNSSGDYSGWNYGKYNGTAAGVNGNDTSIAYNVETANTLLESLHNIHTDSFHLANAPIITIAAQTNELINRMNADSGFSQFSLAGDATNSDDSLKVAAYSVKSSDPITLKNVPAETRIAYSSGIHSVVIKTSEMADIEIWASDNNTGDVKITSSEDAEAVVTYSYQQTADGDTTESVIKCNLEKGKETEIKKNSNDDIRTTGVVGIEYQSNTGKRDEYAQIQNPTSHGFTADELSPEKEYKIEDTDKATLQVKDESTGGYTEVETSDTGSVKQPISDTDISGISSQYEYTGNPIQPKPVVTISGTTLSENVDYIISYTDNTEAGKATVTITGIGSYKGTVTLTFDIVKSEHTHTWTAWETVKEATCKEAGLKKRKCTNCDQEETESIPKTDTHTFGDWMVVKEATATEEGQKKRTCTVCGYEETEAIPKTSSDSSDDPDPSGGNTEQSYKIDSVNFPDSAFRKYVSSFDSNKDGSLSVTEIKKVKKIEVPSKGIKSLKGVELFENLEELDCGYNDLKTLDISKNRALKKLWARGNDELSKLDVSKNTELELLNIWRNPITKLDISKNTKLRFLECKCPIKTLDITKNPSLLKAYRSGDIILYDDSVEFTTYYIYKKLYKSFDDEWLCVSRSTRITPKFIPRNYTPETKVKVATIKYTKVKKKAQTIKLSTYIRVVYGYGKITYTKVKGNKKISINSKTGKAKIKKGLKKGKYKIKVKVTAAGNAYFKPKSKVVTFTVKIK